MLSQQIIEKYVHGPLTFTELKRGHVDSVFSELPFIFCASPRLR